MTIRDIIPWRKREKDEALAPRKFFDDSFFRGPFEMNRWFENFFGDPGFGLMPRSFLSFTPRVDVSETATAIKVEAELPGIDEKDLEVSLEGDALILKGEKKEEKEETTKGVHRLERSFGSFYRRVPLPVEVDPDKVEAVFKNGVVTITLPKAKASTAKTIKVKTS